MSDQATKQVNVSQQFAHDFLLVTSAYHCSLSDIADMKQAAREHIEDAKTTFRSLAKRIMEGEL